MQKEQLSALMDGELFDTEFVKSMSQDRKLQQAWYHYHLVRDTLRGDIVTSAPINIADNVFAAISQEAPAPIALIPEAQPTPDSWQKMPFWHKVKPWFSHLGQAGVAASVALAVLVGVQHYNHTGIDEAATGMPTFNTFSIGNLASPVSYDTALNAEQSRLQDHRRHFALLQDYELQRRLHAEPINWKEVEQTEAHKDVETDTQ